MLFSKPTLIAAGATMAMVLSGAAMAHAATAQRLDQLKTKAKNALVTAAVGP